MFFCKHAKKFWTKQRNYVVFFCKHENIGAWRKILVHKISSFLNLA